MFIASMFLPQDETCWTSPSVVRFRTPASGSSDIALNQSGGCFAVVLLTSHSPQHLTSPQYLPSRSQASETGDGSTAPENMMYSASALVPRSARGFSLPWFQPGPTVDSERGGSDGGGRWKKPKLISGDVGNDAGDISFPLGTWTHGEAIGTIACRATSSVI